MQMNAYRNGMSVGKTIKRSFIFFRHLRQKMTGYSGQSKFKRTLANLLFILILASITGVISLVLYFLTGLIGVVLVILAAFFLPKYCANLEGEDETIYDFNDGYRDGPEGYGYYSGGYKVDE